MSYSQFSVEKCTLFLSSPLNFKFATVFLALHRPNFARLVLLLTELIIHVKSFPLSTGESYYIHYKQTERPADDHSYQRAKP